MPRYVYESFSSRKALAVCLTALCVWLVPDEGGSPLRSAGIATDPRRRKLAAWYAAGAAATAAVAVYLGGWSLWLLWIAVSLAVVAAIYAFFDERAFQKSADGSMSLAARWLLAPYLAGAWLNSRWWTRSSPLPDAVLPGLLIGRIPTRAERDAHGIRSMVDMTAELPCASSGVRYISVPQLDLTSPSAGQLERAVRAIESAMTNGPVLVCCALGFSRSAAAVAAWLVASGRAAAAAEAVEQVRRARPAAVLGPEFLDALNRFARRPQRQAERGPGHAPEEHQPSNPDPECQVVVADRRRQIGRRPDPEETVISSGDIVPLMRDGIDDLRARQRHHGKRDSAEPHTEVSEDQGRAAGQRRTEQECQRHC